MISIIAAVLIVLGSKLRCEFYRVKGIQLRIDGKIHPVTFTLFIALAIAAIKSTLVINIFMHIKFDEPIFKAFLGISGATLFIIFLLTFFDYLYR